MSSMLEQAIVDADALRGAAIKSAEQAVVNQFAEQIKDTVEELLEQGPLPAAPGEEVSFSDELATDAAETELEEDTEEATDADEQQASESGLKQQIADAFDPTIPDDAIIELDLDNLDFEAGKEEIKVVSEDEDEDLELDEDSLKELAEDDDEFELNEALLEELLGEKTEVPAPKEKGPVQQELGAVCMKDEDCKSRTCMQGKVKSAAAKKECPECKTCQPAAGTRALPGGGDAPVQKESNELGESITMDYENKSDGWMNSFTSTDKKLEALEMQEILDALEEYNNELEEKNNKITKENIELKGQVGTLLKNTNLMASSIKEIKNKFDSVQLMNAKLFYSNRILMDTSLNERQRDKIVESIDNASSVEEAKIVYETLQSTVGTFKEKTETQSLSEVVGRHNSSAILLRSRKGEKREEKQDDFAKRMKMLAGIDK